MRRTILALFCFLAMANFADAGIFRRRCCNQQVATKVVCDCGSKCNCTNCACDSRRLVPAVVTVATAPVWVPIRIVSNCLGGCCK